MPDLIQAREQSPGSYLFAWRKFSLKWFGLHARAMPTMVSRVASVWGIMCDQLCDQSSGVRIGRLIQLTR
jgi:hypothetical protein